MSTGLWVLLIICGALILWCLRAYSWLPALFHVLKKKLPRLSHAEQEAMRSGDTWWESAVFQGKLNWDELLSFEAEELSTEEKQFLSDVVDPFCACLDNHTIAQECALPEVAWEHIREGKLWGVLLPVENGGLGFTVVALAAIVARIASRNIAAAITVMVPNTVGPAAFIELYGTEDQRNWLPKFAFGEWVGCFALTATLAGSDASSIQDKGVVCRQGNELGLLLNWDKRYITLAPKADCLCLAVKVVDPSGLLPDAIKPGITLVLVQTDQSGVQIGHAHQPMTAGLVNGTTQGKDVWLPLTAVMGGAEGIGRGWTMMMDELAAGRGLSLPSLSTALCQMAFRMTHIYGKARRQFSRSLLEFSGIKEGYVRLAGFALLSRSVHWFTVQGLAKGIRPAIAAAVAKYHLTELARQSVNISMDIHGGRAAQLGSRNYLKQMYDALPVMVTVEGANILTRHLIIFGQSLIRCHPYVGQEWEALKEDMSSQSLSYFEGVFWRHLGSFCKRACQCAWSRLTGGRHFFIPKEAEQKQVLRRWLRLSQAFSWITDSYLLSYGGKLKENETISALLGDVVSYLYMLLCVWMYQREQGEGVALDKLTAWVMNYCLRQAQLALIALVREFPTRWMGRLIRCVVFPTRLVYDEVKGNASADLVQEMIENDAILNHLTQDCYRAVEQADATGRMENLNRLFTEAAPSLHKLQQAMGRASLSDCFGNNWFELVEQAKAQNLAVEDCKIIQALAERCWDVLQVD